MLHTRCVVVSFQATNSTYTCTYTCAGYMSEHSEHRAEGFHHDNAGVQDIQYKSGYLFKEQLTQASIY